MKSLIKTLKKTKKDNNFEDIIEAAPKNMIAVKAAEGTEIFTFPTKEAMKSFVAELKKLSNVEYAYYLHEKTHGALSPEEALSNVKYIRQHGVGGERTP